MKVSSLHPSLGIRVFERLNEIQELPSSGILAGQAVASVLDHLADKGQSPINDLDVFYLDTRCSTYQHRLQSGKMLQMAQRVEILPSSLGGSDYSDYGHFNAYLAQLSKYTLKAVDRKGLLNRIYVNMDFSKAREAHPELPARDALGYSLIEEFDINCTQVALDLRTKRLVWTPAFEKFFQGRQLQFCTAHTPSHSLVRILRKEQEIENAHLRKEEALLICSTITQSKWYQTLTQSGLVAPLFGDKIKSQFEATTGWKDYFELVPQVVTSRNNKKTQTFHRVAGLQTPDASLQNRVDNLGIGGVKWVANVVRSHLDKSSDKARIYYKQFIHDSDLEFKDPPSGKHGKKKNGYGEGCFFYSRSSWAVDLSMVVQGAHYFEKANFSQGSLKQLKNFLKKHPRLGSSFLEKPLRTQMAYLKTIRELIVEHGSEVPVAIIYQNNLGKFLEQPEVLKPLVTQFMAEDEKNSEGLIPKNIEGFEKPPFFTITELCTRTALAIEGEQMRHCVGGYLSSVLENRCRIFSLSSGGRSNARSTLELQIRKVVKSEKGRLPLILERFTVAQHRGFANRTPSREHAAVAEALAEFLSQQSLKDALEKARTSNSSSEGGRVERAEAA